MYGRLPSYGAHRGYGTTLPDDGMGEQVRERMTPYRYVAPDGRAYTLYPLGRRAGERALSLVGIDAGQPAGAGVTDVFVPAPGLLVRKGIGVYRLPPAPTGYTYGIDNSLTSTSVIINGVVPTPVGGQGVTLPTWALVLGVVAVAAAVLR